MKYALDIRWARDTSLPSLIGPFDSRAKAQEWERLNTTNDDRVAVRALHDPYQRRGAQ